MSAKTILIKHTGKGNSVRVSADSDNTVRTAADILARREYGKRGAVAALHCDSQSGAGSTWQAFIGQTPTQAERRKGANGVTGRNIWIYA